MTLRTAALILCTGFFPAPAQLPQSEPLPANDSASFRAEIDRLDGLLTSAADKPTITYQMARTWAAAKQWPEAIEWLRKVADLKAGLDPSRDPVFAELRRTSEFAELLTAFRLATPPVSHSRVAFVVSEGNLVPENLAYDPTTGSFYFGSLKQGKIVRCSQSGACRNFAHINGIVLGLKVRQGGLWVLSDRDEAADLIEYDLKSGRILGQFPVAGASHKFNDLAIASSGDIYVTDTKAGAVWQLRPDGTHLRKLTGEFQSANGIALSADGTLLYVSDYPDGVSVVTLRTGNITPIGRPPDLSLGAVDGLYFHEGALIAIQNGFMNPRVVRFALSPDGRSIKDYQVLERRNPLFEGITTGVLVGSDFYYMANIQDEKSESFNPISILRLRVEAVH